MLTGYFGRFVKRKQGGRTETQNVSVPPRRSTRRVHTPPPTHPPLTTLVRRRCAKNHFNPSQAGARFLVLCFRALMVATAQVQLAANTSPRASHTQHDCLRPSRSQSVAALLAVWANNNGTASPTTGQPTWLSARAAVVPFHHHPLGESATGTTPYWSRCAATTRTCWLLVCRLCGLLPDRVPAVWAQPCVTLCAP